MGITLILTRSIDRNLDETGLRIGLDEWLDFVQRDPTLRFQQEPYVIQTPSGSKISSPVAEAQAELEVGGQFCPLLYYHDGELCRGYSREFENPLNPVRQKIAEVARKFNAIISQDCGDQIVEW